MGKEKHYRSLLKGISWRFFASIDTLIITLIITGTLKYAIAISIVEVVTKIVLYYVHERIWNKLKLGRTNEPEYQI